MVASVFSVSRAVCFSGLAPICSSRTVSTSSSILLRSTSTLLPSVPDRADRASSANLTAPSVSYHLILRFVDQQWEQLIVKGIGQRLIILPFRLYSDNAAGQVDIRFRLLFVQERRALVGGGIVDQDVHLFSSKLVVRYSDAKASVIFMLV